MEKGYIFLHRGDVFVWKNDVLKIEFVVRQAINAYEIRVSQKQWNKQTVPRSKMVWRQGLCLQVDSVAVLEEFKEQLELLCDSKPNKEWIPVREFGKHWGHKLTYRAQDDFQAYEMTKRARVGCEWYDLFLGRKMAGGSRFGVSATDLKREHVEQLILCLRAYLKQVKKKRGED